MVLDLFGRVQQIGLPCFAIGSFDEVTEVYCAGAFEIFHNEGFLRSLCAPYGHSF